jgi:hypothetical protein
MFKKFNFQSSCDVRANNIDTLTLRIGGFDLNTHAQRGSEDGA